MSSQALLAAHREQRGQGHVGKLRGGGALGQGAKRLARGVTFDREAEKRGV